MPPQGTPITSTQTLHPNDQTGAFPQPDYTEGQKTHIVYRRQRLIAARESRDAIRDEFDGMSFLKWYEIMKRADDQYVAPRKNKQDTSINTGTIRDKDTFLVQYATKYDFEPVAQVYDDDDDMLEELAETGEDLVRKSLMLEQAREKFKLIYRSMVAFGTAMVEDQYVERWTLEKHFGTQAQTGSVQAQWTERKVKTYDGCQMKLWDLRKCYFGDILKFFMNGPQGQPYFFTVEYEHYDVVKQLFGDWDMWKYVPSTIVTTAETQAAEQYAAGWSLRPVSLNYVEIVRYYDPILNEYAITLNGIDMLPIMSHMGTQNGEPKEFVSGFPLTAVSPSGAIPFAKYDFEPMHDFAYSKGQPAKMRVLADIENMWMKLMLGMMKQKAKPTMGNKSGRNFDSSVTDPGTIINDIRDGDVFPVLPNFKGIDAADTGFYQLLKTELDKNSVESSFQGRDNTQQDETATADMNNFKAQSLMMGAMFDGIISGNTQLYWLRTYNISRNWTKPVSAQVDTMNAGIKMTYRTVTMPTEVNGGQKATKKIMFTKKGDMPSGASYDEQSQAVHQNEIDDAKANGGKEERHVYLDVDQFATMKYSWYYTCIPVPNGDDPLAYMMFAKQVTDAMNMFGPDSLNVKKLKHRFAKKTGEDFDTWFLNEQELQQKQNEQMQQQAQAAGQAGKVPGQGVGGAAPSNGTATASMLPASSMGSVMK